MIFLQDILSALRFVTVYIETIIFCSPLIYATYYYNTNLPEEDSQCFCALWLLWSFPVFPWILFFFHHVVLCRQLDSVIQCSLVFACRLEFHSSLVFVFLRDVFIPLPRLFPPFVTQYNVKVFLSAFLLCWHLLYSTYSYALSNIFPFVRLSATLLQPSIPIIVHRPFLIFWTVNHFCQMAEGQI